MTTPVVIDGIVCSHCHAAINTDAPTVTCRCCAGTFHQECWQESGGCPIPGCTSRLHPQMTTTDHEHELPDHRHVSRRVHPPLIIGIVAVALALIAVVLSMLGVSINHLLLIGVVLAALGFDFVNGMNDSGNAIATVISTRVLTPIAALIMAAVLNFVGAVVMEGVAKNIAGNIVDLHAFTVTPLMILCGLLGAIGWSFLMARIGLPISMSHALIGGLVGAFLIAGAHQALKVHFIGQIALWMALAPLIGFIGGWILMLIVSWIFRNVAPHKMHKQFRFWQLLSSALMAFSHGANDAQKAMGIITLALFAGGVIHVEAGATAPEIPLMVKIACAVVIALGTGVGGRRVIATLGHKIIKLTPVDGFAAEAVAASTIQLATHLSIPISTTHVISSSILGVGSSKRLSAVRWGVAGNIVTAWVLTIPFCGFAAAVLYGIMMLLGFDPGLPS